jgi:hypothetical protein
MVANNMNDDAIIPDDAVAIVFTSDGEYELLLPAADELTVPDYVLRAIIVATIQSDKNRDLLDQLTDRFYAAAVSFAQEEAEQHYE